MRCIGGPADGERRLVAGGATTLVVPLVQRAPNGSHMAAVYEVRRRRRGRGVGYPVLVFVRKRPIEAGTEASVAPE